MRSLTDTAPKPLLQVQGQPLLQWHLAARQEEGGQVVLNTAGLGAQISDAFLKRFRPLALAGQA